MIYHVYFERAGGQWADPSKVKDLVAAIKNSDDFFVFALNNRQMKEERWPTFVAKHGLEEYIQLRLPRPITNINYPTEGRKLHLFVLSTQKMEGEKYVSGTFCAAV
jgi:hypothetical protein